MPDQIEIALVTELRLYGFWRGAGLFTEFLKILENQDATGLGGPARALAVVGIGRAHRHLA